jgi:tetratricopeptide (TPR) repeat protein
MLFGNNLNGQYDLNTPVFDVKMCVNIADSLYSRGSYYSAIEFYERAYELDPEIAYISYKMGWTYFKSRNYEQAEFYFREAFEISPKIFPDAQYYYAQMLKRNERYALAIDEFINLKSKYKGAQKNIIKSWCRKEIESCDFALEQKRIKPNYSIEHLDNKINSYYSDLSPVIKDSITLIYSSLKTDSILKSEDKNIYIILYESKKNNGVWDSSYLFNDIDISSDGHIANACYSKDKTQFFFSVCNYKGLDKAECDIYRSRYNQMEESWNPPRKLEESINDKKSTNTQPNIGLYKDGKEVLYFVSDREGGVGGLDIWYSVIDENGELGWPKNCGKRINTDRDEFSPFYENKSNSIYFSSEGHNGFGGLDVFNAKGMTRKWQYPINLGHPINSSVDDIYFNIDSEGKGGFFTSNRSGSLTLKHPTCCDDIYSYEKLNIIEISLKGNLIVMHDSLPRVRDSIQLSILFSDSLGRDLVLLEEKLLNTDSFEFEIKEDQCYTLKASAEKDSFIFEGEKTFCTYGVFESGDITQNINLEAFRRSKRYNINDIEFNKPYPLINAISFNKFKLNKKSKESLMDLYAFLKENEKLVIKIVSHTDNLGTESYNARLSKRRAESVVKFLASEGISKKRLSAEGKGEGEPIAPNTLPDGTDNEKGREKNRRTEFVVTGVLP